jgi:hypothetical protein
MFDAYVIEVADQAVGIVTRDGPAFRFHSAIPKFSSLDGQRFRTPSEATLAARTLVSQAGPTRP